jgi:peptidyl-prolyl cis-trans isomerase SurA
VAEAQAKADRLLDQLRKGAKFEDLAKKFSDGPTAAQGGTLGSFKRGELAKDLEDKTFALKPGETTDVIRTRQGFIILKVTGHRAAGVPPVKDIADKIREAIYSERLEPAARAYLTKLREAAYIDVKPGYTDTGASPNQTNKPVVVAANEGKPIPGKPAAKKKKKFVVF